MVNVAGRSKGCSTCRKRRVKCDEGRPVCGRCLRCGYKCDGVRDITFVEAKIVESRRSKRPTIVSGMRDSDDSQLPLSAPLKGVDFEIYVCYTLKVLLRDGLVGLSLQGLRLTDVVTAATAAAEGRIFHQAVLGFSIVYFGIQHRQEHITRRGYAVHGAALKQLNEALSQSDCYARDEVIISVVTLALLECWVPTGHRHYLKHMMGLQRLLELRGPLSDCANSSVSLYKALRQMILFACLQSGTPSILARKEWKRTLRATCSDEEIEEQDLFDVLADCTVLAAERDNILAQRGIGLESDVCQREEIKQRTLALLDELRAWRRRWESSARNAFVQTSATSLHARALWGNDPAPFLTAFEFVNDSAATMLMLYDTSLLYVLRILASLTPVNPEVEEPETLLQESDLRPGTGHLDEVSNNTTKDGYVAAERLATLEICGCILHYLNCNSKRSDQVPSAVVNFAVATAWTLGGNVCTAEGRWMTDLLKRKSRNVLAKGLWPG